MWMLRKKYADKYSWLVPIPGEWHWTWHILKAIFKMFGITILKPFADILGFSSLDLEANNFHYAEDLLQMVTIGIMQWIKQCMTKMQIENCTTWLHEIRSNKQAYELAYACIYYFIPYWYTRSVIKFNVTIDFDEIWRWWIHLFIAAGKHNYSVLSIRYLWIVRSMNPEIREIYDSNRIMSFSGEPGTGIPYDAFNEIVSIRFRFSLKFRN
jgi:hypothetical protein